MVLRPANYIHYQTRVASRFGSVFPAVPMMGPGLGPESRRRVPALRAFSASRWIDHKELMLQMLLTAKIMRGRSAMRTGLPGIEECLSVLNVLAKFRRVDRAVISEEYADNPREHAKWSGNCPRQARKCERS